MSEVDALFRMLDAAPPRSAEIVKRVALAQMGWAQFASLYGVDEARAKVIVFRAFVDVMSGGSVRFSDEQEPFEVEAMLSASVAKLHPAGGAAVRQLWDRYAEHRVELQKRLEQQAADFAASPDRVKEERWRYIAIVLIIALASYFYWREKQRQPESRPAPADRRR